MEKALSIQGQWLVLDGDDQLASEERRQHEGMWWWKVTEVRGGLVIQDLKEL